MRSTIARIRSSSIGAGEVTLGCLSPGIAYEIAVDVIGDPLGPLTKRLVTVPGT